MRIYPQLVIGGYLAHILSELEIGIATRWKYASCPARLRFICGKWRHYNSIIFSAQASSLVAILRNISENRSNSQNGCRDEVSCGRLTGCDPDWEHQILEVIVRAH